MPLDEGPIVYPLPVGGTPFVAPPVLRARLGLPNLWLKDETRGPSGSNKDRATALVLQQAMSSGTSRVTCASTGTVAVSLAVGAAAAGKQAVNFVASDVDDGKVALMLHVGATVIKVQGGYGAAFRLSVKRHASSAGSIETRAQHLRRRRSGRASIAAGACGT